MLEEMYTLFLESCKKVIIILEKSDVINVVFSDFNLEKGDSWLIFSISEKTLFYFIFRYIYKYKKNGFACFKI